jgi:hypothetical protein
MMDKTILLVAGLVGLGCSVAGGDSSQGATATPSGEDIAKLSDEFDNPATLAAWKHIDKTEGWNADQIQRLSFQDGWMTIVPFTNTWYMDYRGVLLYKDVPGDFVVTTRLHVTGRDGKSAPNALFSLGGIMVRSPRSDNARNWRAGGENYVFLSLGSADRVGNYQFEVKTTTQSNSNLEKILAASGNAELKVARVGSNMILLRKQGANWVVHKRYSRPDMPATLQVGLTTYTDYPTASQVSAYDHNGSVIRRGNPDLIASFDYVRFRRPKVPAGMNVGQASDGELLKILVD